MKNMISGKKTMLIVLSLVGIFVILALIALGRVAENRRKKAKQ